MREYFRQQLMAVVQGKQDVYLAYMNSYQLDLMFQVGREVGFKTITQAEKDGQRILLNQHDPYDTVYITVSITETCDNYHKVKVVKEENPLKTIELIQSWWDPLDYVD